MLYVDAFRWFVDTFGNGGGGDGEEKFDVIIMDALDPSTSVEIAGGLYNDTSFVDSLFNGLSEKGVVSSFEVHEYMLCMPLSIFHDICLSPFFAVCGSTRKVENANGSPG